jgi:hypothetical protein
MARTFKLVSGTDEVDLIAIGSPGIIAKRGGFGPNRNQPRLTFTSSSLADSARLRLKKTLPVTDRYILNMRGSSHDNIASQLQTLQRILRKGDLFHLTKWQQEPLYVQQQTTNETNARYSTVLAWNGDEIADLFDQPYESLNELEDFEILLVREPYWRSHAPQTLPSEEPGKTRTFPYFDQEVGTVASLVVSEDAALSGDWGASVEVDGVGSEAYWRISLGPAGSVTEITLQFRFKLNTVELATGEVFDIVNIKTFGGGVGDPPFELILQNTGTNTVLTAQCKSDAGVNSFPANYILDGVEDTTLLVRLECKVATAPGANNGSLELFIDNVSQGSKTDIDNDLAVLYEIDFGAVTGIDAGTSGIFFVDDISWDDAVPAVAWERTIDFETTRLLLSNYRDSTVLTHIYNEDNSATGFSDNLVYEPSFDYFVVSGSTPAINDAIYFGSDNPFFSLAFNFITSGLFSPDERYEYSQGGAAWAQIGIASPWGAGGSAGDDTGLYIFSWEGASDWATDTVNGQTKYWIRVRINSAPSGSFVPPAQGDNIVYIPNDVYFELNEAQIHGDVAALTYMTLYSQSLEGAEDITRVIAGVKNNVNGNFTSRLNAGGDNPAIWTEAYGTDTTQTADPQAPGGNNATCTFATNQSMIDRVTFNLLSPDADEAADYEGTYRIYLRCQQVGGSAGDVSVRLENQPNLVEILGETIKLPAVGKLIIVDLGEFSLRPLGYFDTEAVDSRFVFIVQAQSDNGTTPNLEVYDLILIPIDEVVVSASWTGTIASSIDRMNSLNIDSGIYREAAFSGNWPSSETTYTVKVPWEVRGALPEIEPRRKLQLHFLFWGDDSGDPISECGMGFNTRIYVHERWYRLRGLD